MYTTSKLGHRETLRERLKRSMNRQKAGLSLTAEDERELVLTRSADTEDQDSGDDAHEAMQQVPPTTTETKPKQQTKSGSSDKILTPSAKTATTEPEQTSAGGKNKRKKKKAMVTSIVPTAEPMEVDEQQSVLEQNSQSASDKMQQDAAAATTAPSSQNAAMARLEALRKKNEAKRLQKLQAAQQPTQPPSTAVEQETAPGEVYVPKPVVLKSRQEVLELSKQTKLDYKTKFVQLKRKPEIQLARMQLPVCSSEQEIMEAIIENDVIILCGETGSGKTTQVPQFLYEAGYGHPDHPQCSGRIGVTQPRRVAAVSTAKRVAEELNVGFGSKGHVGYQIRYDAEYMGDQTRIKFMTDGILLKEIQQDFLLRQYSILLLDEAHERNVNTDILIGLLSRIAPLRAQMAREEQEAFDLLTKEEQSQQQHAPLQPLKLVVMSATLRVEDFTQNERLFPTPPPVLRVDARQYPVTVHFNKRTELDNYVDEAYKKVMKIHKKLPEGGVLVFLTGQREIVQLCRKLKRASAAKRKKATKGLPQHRDNEASQPTAAIVPKDRVSSANDRVLREHDDIEEEADLEDEKVYGSDEVAYDLGENDEPNSDEDDEDIDEEDEDEGPVPYLHVLPLYSLLPQDEQMKVFETPPDQHRLIVVATNVAETSLTIPGIKYVVDAGRTKERVFDLANGISSFEIQWISKASADQRAGRAGRTGPGHCYRLYSSAVYDTEFAKFSSPEILCQPIEDLVLQMKAMGIHNVLQFPFPTPPDRLAVQAALTTLVHLGAISAGESESITALGHTLVKFPVAARFAKMLLLAKELGVLEYTIAIVAGLSGHSPFIHALDRKEQQSADAEADEEEGGNNKKAEDEEDMAKEWREAEELRKHAQWVDQESDVLSLLRAAGAYAYTGGSAQFCQENHLHEKTMQNMLKLRHQLTRIVNQMYELDDSVPVVAVKPRMPPPDHETQFLLRQIVAAGFLDQVGKRAPVGTITEGSKIERNCAFITATRSVHEPVYIHPHSCVFTPDPSKLPPFVVYQHIMRSTRAYMKMVTVVEPSWLASIGHNTPLCKYSAPLSEPAPFYDATLDQVQCYVKPQFGMHAWTLPIVVRAFPDTNSSTQNDELQSKYRWFAKFLLDGQVVPGLAPFAHVLRTPSHALVRKKFEARIQLLVHKLRSSEVASRQALVHKWQLEDKLFLREELKQWIQSDHQQRFLGAWSSILASAGAM